MANTIIHLSLDISGALRRPKDWVNFIRVDGKLLATATQVKKFLESELALGHKYLPFNDKCEEFSYETGCPGHVKEEIRE